jgi:predicted glycosyltransferase
VDILKLPGMRKVSNTSYAARRLSLSAPETSAMRSALIASATESFRPQVLLSDKHPHGAHGELRAALAVLRAAGGRAVLGLRDILDEPATVRAEWQAAGVLDAIARDYDRVLVYGSRSVLDPAEVYGMTAPVRRMVRYCGYVANTPPDHDGTPLSAAGGRPVVVATAGGGEDGYAVLQAFVDASRGAPWHPVVVSGSDAPADEAASLQRQVAQIGGTYHRFVRNLPVHFPDIAALVCMAGYNTTTEALRAAVPTVLVPRVAPRQEQLLRARAFARLGLLQSVEPADLHGARLALAVHAALRDPRDRIRSAVQQSLDVDGAGRAAAELLALVTPVREARLSSVLQEPVDVAV